MLNMDVQMKWCFFVLLGTFVLSFSTNSFGNEDYYEDLDGVYINALDEYPSLKKNEMSFGFSYFPFDPYFHGVGFNGSYTRYLNKRWGWEILSGNFLFQIEKGLTNELAEKWNAQPDLIEQTEYVLSSNLKYVISYGKNIFFDRFIRMNRTELIFGLGTIGTNINNYIAFNLGFQFDFAINEKYSWKLEFINHMTFERGRGEFTDFGAIKAMLAWRFK